MLTTAKANEQAIERYKEINDRLQSKMQELKTAIARHAAVYENGRTHWGHVGDIAVVEATLDNLQGFVDSSNKAYDKLITSH